jgi:GH43 family beta-xylosidase
MKGSWTMKGKVADPAADHWAIDADVTEYQGQLYMAWSGWQGDANGEQDIYIARLRDPWTMDGRKFISIPTYEWDTGFWRAREGGAIAGALIRGDRPSLTSVSNPFTDRPFPDDFRME